MTEDTSIYIAILDEYGYGEVYKITQEAYNSYLNYDITQDALIILGEKICILTDRFIKEVD